MNDEQVPAPMPSQQARQWAMFCHFAAFLGLVFPFGNLLGPLIVWQIKKDFDPFVDTQGKEALNFQITVAIEVCEDGRLGSAEVEFNPEHGAIGVAGERGQFELIGNRLEHDLGGVGDHGVLGS